MKVTKIHWNIKLKNNQINVDKLIHKITYPVVFP